MKLIYLAETILLGVVICIVIFFFVRCRASIPVIVQQYKMECTVEGDNGNGKKVLSCDGVKTGEIPINTDQTGNDSIPIALPKP